MLEQPSESVPGTGQWRRVAQVSITDGFNSGVLTLNVESPSLGNHHLKNLVRSFLAENSKRVFGRAHACTATETGIPTRV